MCVPPNGVTTVVDAGSAGTANFDAFYRTVICASKVRIKAFLTVSPPGQTQSQKIMILTILMKIRSTRCFASIATFFRGLKLKVQTGDIAEYGLKPLTESLRIANDLKYITWQYTRLIHRSHEELVSLLRRGDIIAHAFHGKGSTILTDEGAVCSRSPSGRERGRYI